LRLYLLATYTNTHKFICLLIPENSFDTVGGHQLDDFVFPFVNINFNVKFNLVKFSETISTFS